ncbi:MAG: hypothetical protein QM767_16760 [Anaeromyxobacter sp.]
MSRRGRGFAEALFETGTKLVSRAAAGVMADPRGQEALARAVGLAQRGRQQLEALQEKAMHAAGIPGRQDYQDLARQLARIKRKTRELAERLDGLGEKDSEAPGGDETDPSRTR